MTTILLATPCVGAGCLKMTVGEGTDPDILIGWRDRQLANSGEFSLVDDLRAIGAEIFESIAGAFAPDAARPVGDIA